MFEHIFKRQKEFQSKFFVVGGLHYPAKVQWTKEFILCLHQELAEVMNTLRWKSYHTYQIERNEDETKEEIIDCFKFVLNLMIVWEMTPGEILKRFDEKSDIVEKRLTQK